MKNGAFSLLLRLISLIVCLFVVNFLFARFAPGGIRENTLISAAIIAILDGIAIFLFMRIWNK